MRATHLVLLVLSLALPACSAAHRSSEATPGIYDLTIRGDVDACTPARATGTMGEVGVVITSGVLNLPVPDATEADPLRVSLARETGFHGETEMALDGCVGASLTRSWTVLDTSEDTIAVAYRESWRGIEGCGEGLRYVMPAAPTADCEAHLVLDYHLATPCAAPCEVSVAGAGVACVCD